MNRNFGWVFAAVLSLGGALRGAEVERDRTGSNEARPAARDLVTDLSEEERVRLRRAVQQVWGSQEVTEAREDLQRATQAFRRSLKKAIDAQEDPELRRLMTRLLAERYAHETRNARSGLKPASRRAAAHDAPLQNSAKAPSDASARHSVTLDREDQAVLALAREKAMRDPEVIAVLRERETAVDQRAKMIAAGKYRRVMRAAMLRLEPEVRGVLAKLESRTRGDRG